MITIVRTRMTVIFLERFTIFLIYGSVIQVVKKHRVAKVLPAKIF